MFQGSFNLVNVKIFVNVNYLSNLCTVVPHGSGFQIDCSMDLALVHYRHQILAEPAVSGVYIFPTN